MTPYSSQMTPHIHGTKVTFVWDGDLAPGLVGDFNGFDMKNPLPLTRDETGVWSVTLEFAADAYMEYFFVLDGERVLDPRNPRTLWNGIHELQNWFRMPESQPSRYIRRVPGLAKRGEVIETAVIGGELVIGGVRDAILYKPPTDDPVPLIGVFDGPDYFRRASLANIVDNLIAEEKIRPVALVMAENAKQGRMIEYLAHDLTVMFYAETLMEFAREHVALIDEAEEPGIHGIMGASMGGLMALYAGFRLPEVFGHVISQSGAFGIEFRGHRLPLWDLIRLTEKPPIRIWQDVGRYEWLLETNREMRALLEEKGYDLEYREYSAGHNYTAWADQLADALIYQYGV